MKQLRKFSTVLKVTGIVLICCAAAMWLYSLANTGSSWTTLRNAVNSVGSKTEFGDRLRFDNRFFLALSNATTSRNQPEEARTEALRVIGEDPNLDKPEHRKLRERVSRMFSSGSTLEL